MKYRKKPVVIEAIQLTRFNIDDVAEFAAPHPIKLGHLTTEGSQIIIPTLEGDHIANPGDWIIRGVQGEIYPCKPDIFKATYEAAD